MADLTESLQSFVTYVQTHLTGDEKGEDADFLDHLFRALVARGEDRARAQRFILQLLVTLVSEDMHLLPRQMKSYVS